MLMRQSGSAADGEHPVALTGRVYCWADASSNPVKPGDLLTTSDTPGHAMKVTDYAKAQVGDHWQGDGGVAARPRACASPGDAPIASPTETNTLSIYLGEVGEKGEEGLWT